jgi:hypothetical protein
MYAKENLLDVLVDYKYRTSFIKGEAYEKACQGRNH